MAAANIDPAPGKSTASYGGPASGAARAAFSNVTPAIPTNGAKNLAAQRHSDAVAKHVSGPHVR